MFKSKRSDHMPKILIINSSHRKNSNSAALAGKIAEGAQAAGHSVESVDISRLEIRPCRGCCACTAPDMDGCVQKDGMTGLYPKVREADILIFASPVYWFNMSGQLKQFIDRLFAICIKPDEHGKSLLAYKSIAAVMAFGDSDPYNSGAVNALRSFQDICAYSGAKWLGAVYGSANDAGEIAGNAAALEAALEFGKNL